jgi:DNA polymerase-3 subunit gamma/tau
VSALAAGDGKRLLAEMDRLAELTPDFAAVLTELITLLHRVALAQQVPTTVADEDPEAEALRRLAADVPVEDVQLFYQILLTGQRDLPLAPDPRTGFEMVLLRALAFRPASVPAASGGGGAGVGTGRSSAPAVAAGTPPTPQGRAGDDRAEVVVDRAGEVAGGTPLPGAPTSGTGVAVGAPAPVLRSAEDWHRLVAALPLAGLASQLAAHCALVSWDGKHLRVALAESLANLRAAGAEQRLGAALAQTLGCEVALSIDVVRTNTASGDTSAEPARLAETPAGRDARNAAERVAAAEAVMDADPVVNELKRRFDADWVPGSIRPTE